MVLKAKNNASQNLFVEASLYVDSKKNNKVLIFIIHQLLIFAGVFGTVFSFLSCIMVSYNMVLLIFLSVLFSLITNVIFSIKKIHSQITVLVVSIFYLGCVFIYRNNICAGIFYIINIYLSQARNKYRDTVFMELINPENAYRDTNIFLVLAVFLIAFVISYGINKRNLPAVLLVSAPVLELCLYYGFVPNYAAFIALIICWTSVIALDVSIPDRANNKPYKRASAQCGLAAAIIMLICFIAAILYVKISGFERPESVDNFKSSVSNYVENNTVSDVIEDITSLSAVRTANSGAINHGKLGKNGDISFKNKTVLQVTLPRSRKSTYLRGFVGEVYTGNSWISLPNAKYKQLQNITENFQLDNLNVLLLDGKNLSYIDRSLVPKYSFSVKNVSASKDYLYMPYNLVSKSVSSYDIQNFNHFAGGLSTLNYVGQFYDPNDYYGYKMILSTRWNVPSKTLAEDELLYRNFVNENYMTLPENFKAPDVVFNEQYYTFISAEDGNVGKSTVTAETIFSRKLYYIKKWLRDNCEYDLKAGKLPDGKDFVDYFLLESKRGSCSHFASSAVLLCRYAGIPARYVEGYIVTDLDFSKSTTTGATETVEITDARGHAWIEVYINGFGWYPLEVTSGYGNVQTAFTSETVTEISEAEFDISSELSEFESIYSIDTSASEAINPAPAQTTVTVTSPTEQSAVTSTQTTTELTDETTIAEEDNIPEEIILEDNATSSFLTVLKVILWVILSSILIFAAILFRRVYIIKKYRRNVMHTDDYDFAAECIYRKFNKFLLLLKITPMKNLSYSDYIEKLSDSSLYLSDGVAETVINSALKAKFDESPLSRDEVKEMYQTLQTSVKRYYNSSSNFKKLYIKFILCML